jgi:hypothetical protein
VLSTGAFYTFLNTATSSSKYALTRVSAFVLYGNTLDSIPRVQTPCMMTFIDTVLVNRAPWQDDGNIAGSGDSRNFQLAFGLQTVIDCFLPLSATDIQFTLDWGLPAGGPYTRIYISGFFEIAELKG